MESTLVELLGLPEASHVEFENPPLALALCQIKFAPVLGVADPIFVAPFQNAIEDLYPIANSGDQLEVEFGIVQGEPGIRNQSRVQQWQFKDETDTWAVILTRETVSIETRKYESFRDFLDRLNNVVIALVRYIKPKFITRIGLRYINEIRSMDLIWTDIMKHNLLGVTSTPEIAQYTQLANQQIALRFSEQRGIQIHHGYFPAGSTVIMQTGDTLNDSPFYLLDFDVFREFQPNRTRLVNADMICNHVADFNKTIYQLFRWCVSDEYISTLEVRDENA